MKTHSVDVALESVGEEEGKVNKQNQIINQSRYIFPRVVDSIQFDSTVGNERSPVLGKNQLD